MAKIGQQPRSTRLHVVDDDVVVRLVDRSDVHIEAECIAPAQLRNQRLNLSGVVEALRRSLIAWLPQIDPLVLPLACAADEGHTVRRGAQRRGLAPPRIDLLPVVCAQGLPNIPGFASQTFAGRPPKSSRPASRGCTLRPSLDTSEGSAVVTRLIPDSSLARRSSNCT